MTSELELERLGIVSSDVRAFVLDRDNSSCRACGRYLEDPALHHVVFRSQGGPDLPSNLVTIGWSPWSCNCHLVLAHGPESRLWREVFQAAIANPGVTGLQIRRWLKV